MSDYVGDGQRNVFRREINGRDLKPHVVHARFLVRAKMQGRGVASLEYERTTLGRTEVCFCKPNELMMS